MLALQNCPSRRHITTECEHVRGRSDFNRGLLPHDCGRITGNSEVDRSQADFAVVIRSVPIWITTGSPTSHLRSLGRLQRSHTGTIIARTNAS